MREPQENSHTLIQREQRKDSRTDDSRRAFLIGGAAALIGGATILAGGAARLLQPATVSVDPHRILNLPLSGESAPHPFQNLPSVEYAWLPDSIHLAVAIPGKIFLVNVKTGQIAWQQARSLAKEQDAVLLINWSTDGKQIQTVHESGVPGGQVAWPAPSQVYNIGWEGFAFSADQTYLAFHRLNDPYVQIWNIPQRSLVAYYQDPENTLGNPLNDVAMAWSPTSPSLLAIYTNLRQPEIHLWQAEEQRLLWATDISSQPASENEKRMKWSPDGLALAYAYMSDLSYLGVLDAQTSATRFQTTMAPSFPGAIEEAFAWSPDGTRLAFFATEGNETVLQVWQAQTGQHLLTCQRVQGLGLVPVANEPNLYKGAAGIVSWSPDGRYLVAQTLPGDKPAQATLQFWDAHTGKALFSYYAPFEDAFLDWSPHLLWSPDSHFLAAYMATRAACSMPRGFPGHPSCSYAYALQIFQVG